MQIIDVKYCSDNSTLLICSANIIMCKIIILIIASDNEPYYVDMQQTWKKYMNTHQNIKSYFIKGKINEHHNDVYIDEDNCTMYANCEESLIPGILLKTIKCMNFVNANFDYKYIYRTNLSSFINLGKMYDYASKYNFDYGAVHGRHENILFGSGSGFFVHKNTCQYILDNKEQLDYNLYDDVAIGKLLSNFALKAVPRIDMLNDACDFYKMANDETNFHYRCKTGDMNKTCENLKILCALYYKL